MSFLSDLPFVVIGIAVAVFLIKLFVSLRVANKAPVWQELGDKEPGAADADQATAGIRTEQISPDANAVPDQKVAEHLSGELRRASACHELNGSIILRRTFRRPRSPQVGELCDQGTN